MFYTIFYHNSMVVCLAIVHEYDDILVILINNILLINIKFIVKYY
jgi:hypothetical protein